MNLSIWNIIIGVLNYAYKVQTCLNLSDLVQISECHRSDAIYGTN